MEKMVANVDTAMAVATVWAALEAAPALPKGTVVWRAVPSGAAALAKDAKRWMPVSATAEGAEAWAVHNLVGGRTTICRIVVAGSRVRALAVGSDADYEAEKEILIAPGFKASRTGEAHPPTAAGNEVVCFKIVGP